MVSESRIVSLYSLLEMEERRTNLVEREKGEKGQEREVGGR